MRFAVAVFACVHAGAHPAAACSADANHCDPAEAAPASGKTVPSGTTALPFSLGSDPKATAPTLSAADGGVAAMTMADPAVAGGRLLLPALPLAPGAHRLRWTRACGFPDGDAPFDVAAAAPLPSQVGTLVARPQARGRVVGHGCFELSTVEVIRLETRRERAPKIPYSRALIASARASMPRRGTTSTLPPPAEV